MTVGELCQLLDGVNSDEQIRIEFYHEESDSKIIAEIGDVGYDQTSGGFLIREE